HAAVADRLPEGMDAAAWEAIRPNLTRLSDAGDWWAVVESAVAVPSAPEDREFLASAAETAAGAEWNDGIWKALTGALGAETGRKGKSLFLPLRLALTGREHGPDMNALLPLIGKERAVERLKAASA
ncbi:MAG: glutamate--tRNA ligase, partial [Alphaproteobacteria bacterium]